jgi:hypothetical protein
MTTQDAQQPTPENPSTIGSETAHSETDAVEEIAAPSFLPEPPADSSTRPTEGQIVLMTNDEFYEFFRSLFPAIAFGIGMFQPPPLQSLIRAPGLDECRPAADALYRMALRFPWLSWLLDPEAVWMKDLLIIAAFGGKVGYAVAGELHERKAQAGG